MFRVGREQTQAIEVEPGLFGVKLIDGSTGSSGVALLRGWPRPGARHAPHTHPRSYLSGTYYVSVPPAPTSVDDPRARPACISFYDPRTGANMITVGAESDARASHVVRPSAGMLLMWPSPVQHYVHPNLSEERRITISFNVIMDRNTGRK